MGIDKYNFTVNGKCPEGCNECCSNILTVSDKEINRIKKYIKDNNIAIHNHNTIFSGYVDKCPFVNKDGKCDIYSVRPEICSYFDCSKKLEYRPFNHKDKSVVNMLLTFNPQAFCPNAPDIAELNKTYQEKKKKVYGE